jgi:hypothetical protein
MRRRTLLYILLLFGLVPASLSADAISIKIRQVGLENIYALGNNPTLVSFDVRNTTTQSIPVSLLVDEVSLRENTPSVTTSFQMPLLLSPGEERALRVPLHVVPGNNDRLVIYLEARDEHNLIVGRTARLVGPKTDGQVVGLICTTAELCRKIQQSILLSGSPEEQTHKSQVLRMVQLPDPPSEGWAYAAAHTVILAAPIARLSEAQRQALELFLRNGGTLVLIEDQIADGVSSNPGTNPGSRSLSLSDFNALNRNSNFLEIYRTRLPYAKSLRVGFGNLVRLSTVAGNEFAHYFRPLGFSGTTPEGILRQFPRGSPNLQSADESQSTWLMRRLGTSFRFPSFLEILLWMISYLLVVGIVNFVILRRMERPEWGWLTIPAIAIFASVLLYGTSARHRPRNYDLDDMVVYRMDNLSSLATADAKIRVSSPRRSAVDPVVPGEWLYSPPSRNFEGIFEGSRNPGSASSAFVSEYVWDRSWETSLSLRKWSFAELNFFGSRRFAGTISRDSAGRIHNDTGISFRQAIVVDHADILVLDFFPAGAVVDLAQVPRRSFSKESGRSVNRQPEYPGPPFLFHKPDDEKFRNLSEAEKTEMEKEWDNLASQPFSLLELVRGWPRNGDDIFIETKAVFFGLSDDATMRPSLRGKSPDRKSASLTIVTFGMWP